MSAITSSMYKKFRKRKWDEAALREAAHVSFSIRQVLKKLGLVEAGGNYEQIKKYLQEYKIDTSHFKGKGWNKGMRGIYRPYVPLKDILIKDSNFQSYKVKLRLFREGLKKPECEECGWSKSDKNGRIPVELDHKNGNKKDNRLSNLRILCPNCHSLKLTHRGLKLQKTK